MPLWWPKTRSHHTGVSPSSLAPCYCPHSVHNHTADIQDTHYPSTELHSRPTPAALLVMTTQVRQSQHACNSADENQFCSTQLHLRCSTHLEQPTSRHHWQLGRHCKHLRKKMSCTAQSNLNHHGFLNDLRLTSACVLLAKNLPLRKYFAQKYYEICDQYQDYCKLYTDGSMSGDQVGSATICGTTTKTVWLPNGVKYFQSRAICHHYGA